MLVVFVIVEYEISHFFLLKCNLIVDNHESPIFSVSGAFFAWKLFGRNVSIFLLNKTQTRCFPDGCHEIK